MQKALIALLVAFSLTAMSPGPLFSYVAYDTHVSFLEMVSRDLVKLLPRAMGYLIFKNRYDFFRGMTFMTRDIQYNPGKLRDIEEIKRDAYARLMRDIPYCVEAMKGGEIKLDTSSANLAGRLGMIADSIILVKIPEFPDLKYLEMFYRTLDEVVVEQTIDIWVYYDGYPDFNSLGELMERLKSDASPTITRTPNENYAADIIEDIFPMFRPPQKFKTRLVLTAKDINAVYSNIINSIADTYTYIWKSSGMDLSHPSYAAPPGTIIDRPAGKLLSSRKTSSASTVGESSKQAQAPQNK